MSHVPLDVNADWMMKSAVFMNLLESKLKYILFDKL